MLIKLLFLILFIPSICFGAVVLDGADDYLTIVDSEDFTFAADFSISMWVQADVLDVDNRTIYQYDAASGDGFFLGESSLGAGIWRFVVYSGGASDIMDSTVNTTTEWTHLVGVRASGVCTLYVNASAQADTENSAGGLNSSDPVYIGCDRTIAKEFDGQITELAIYNKALSQAEIDNLYESKLKTIPLLIGFSDLKVYIPFDDHETGTALNGTTFNQIVGTNPAVGVDADGDSSASAETILTYPEGVTEGH